METIFALASGPGKSGVAVLRISGPESWAAAGSLCALPPVRVAGLRLLRSGAEVLDQALVLVFSEGHSFTGEAMVELHLHGSQASIAGVSRALAGLGLRPAEAGEFTRRALENGRLDLAQVEGLADLIDAETDQQRRQAWQAFGGGLSTKVDALRAGLVHAGALLAAAIDFSDEDLPPDVQADAIGLIADVEAALIKELQGFGAAERVRDGFEVAIVGAPNVGKSSLLNSLAGRDVAITSRHAGTTRDVIEVRMDIGGLAVTLLDTAGIREAEDEVEATGIRRALQRSAGADLRVLVLDGESLPIGLEAVGDDIVIHNKADLGKPGAGLRVSAMTGQGIDLLVAEIGNRLVPRAAKASGLIRERQRVAVARAVSALSDARSELGQGGGRVELVALHLNEACIALDRLIGRIDVDDLLDQVFSRFCIGK